MKLLWQMMLVTLLALQTIAMPVHAFAQELGHVHTPGGHSHHHAHDHDHNASLNDAADSHEHNCISHCHVSVALLGYALPALPIASGCSFNYRASTYTAKFTEQIDRPQWHAARV